MFRVRAVYAVMLGVLVAAAAQAQHPPGMIQGPMMPPPGAPGMGPMVGGPMMGGPMVGGPMMGGPAGPAMFNPVGPAPVALPTASPGGQYAPGVEQAAFFGGNCGCGCDCNDCCSGNCCGGCGGGCCGRRFPFAGPTGKLECGYGDSGIGSSIPGPSPVIWNHEVEASFLYMDIDGTSTAGQIDAPAIPVAALFLSRDADLDSELAGVPRIWLHCQKCNWGLGWRFATLGESESLFTPLNLLNLNIIGNYSMERIHTLTNDVVATYSCHPGHLSSFQFDVGLRYAEYENESLHLANAAFTDAVAHSSGVASVDFDGVGVTWGVRGTIALHHHVSFFWGARGAYVWGDMRTAAQTAVSAIYSVDPAAGAIDSAGTITEEELMIGEVQLGIQWEHHLHCIPATAFFRVAGEYQHWEIDSGAFSAADSIVQVDVLPAGDVIVSSAQARAQAPYVDMFGISIAAGLTW